MEELYNEAYNLFSSSVYYFVAIDHENNVEKAFKIFDEFCDYYVAFDRLCHIINNDLCTKEEIPTLYNDLFNNWPSLQGNYSKNPGSLSHSIADVCYRMTDYERKNLFDFYGITDCLMVIADEFFNAYYNNMNNPDLTLRKGELCKTKFAYMTNSWDGYKKGVLYSLFKIEYANPEMLIKNILVNKYNVQNIDEIMADINRLDIFIYKGRGEEKAIFNPTFKYHQKYKDYFNKNETKQTTSVFAEHITFLLLKKTNALVSSNYNCSWVSLLYGDGYGFDHSDINNDKSETKSHECDPSPTSIPNFSITPNELCSAYKNNLNGHSYTVYELENTYEGMKIFSRAKNKEIDMGINVFESYIVTKDIPGITRNKVGFIWVNTIFFKCKNLTNYDLSNIENLDIEITETREQNVLCGFVDCTDINDPDKTYTCCKALIKNS